MSFKKDKNIYAVKEISKERASDLKIKRIKREIELTKNLSHDNIVKIYGSYLI